MAATTLADGIRFNATSTGTGDFVDASAVTGYRRGAGNLVDGCTYRYRAENASLSEHERGSGVWNNSTSTLARTTIDYSSTGSKVAFSSIPQVGITPNPEDLGDLCDFAGMTNGTFVASAAAGALTVAVKTLTGADPSANDPVYFFFRDVTLTSGAFSRVKVTSALSVVIGSGNTLGAVSAFGLRVWITAHNDAGTVRLGAINCSPNGNNVFLPSEGLTYGTTTPGNSGRTFYTTVAIATASPWRLLGYVEWSALTTAGTWTAPNYVQLMGPGIKKPGELVDIVTANFGGQNSTTSSGFVVSSLSASIALKSAANIVRASWSTILVIGNSGEINTAALYRNGAAQVGSGAQYSTVASGFNYATAGGMGYDKPNTTASTSYAAYFHNSSGSNLVYFGNGLGATLELQELMG